MAGSAMVQTSKWRSFWNNGGWWKALLLVIFYWVLYQGVAWLIHTLFGGMMTPGGTFASPQNVLIGHTLSILVTGLLMLALAWSFGWLKELFGSQPIRGSWWMWLAVVVVLGFNAVRYAAVDYQAVGVGVTLMTLFLGLCIGFTEELVCRGFAVQLLRRGGYSEWVVAALSSLLFGILHAGNFIGTTDLLPVAVLVAYTFTFGVLMYLSMRVSGTLILAILLHASTDPSQFLITGAIGEQGQVGEASALMPIANLANPVVIIVGLVLLIFIRGRVGRAHYSLGDRVEK
ncbi:CPBP family intramembrane glutamic endopeptidase [Microbacterium sp. 2216-1]|uniref:CPBP family intramembrane glutamic endopeptidase n=1 Tax=Microbacterium sp. 2216-1 TaxID=3390053 RepID=UPI003976C81F